MLHAIFATRKELQADGIAIVISIFVRIVLTGNGNEIFI
jgi:hypothetical protein